MKEYKVLVCKEQMTIKDNQINFNYRNDARIEILDESGIVVGMNIKPTMLSKVDTNEFIINKLREKYDCMAAEVSNLGIVIESNENIIANLYKVIKTYVKNVVGPVVWADTSVVAIMTVNKFTKNLLVNKADKLNAKITVIETGDTDKYLVILTDNESTHKEISLIVNEQKETKEG